MLDIHEYWHEPPRHAVLTAIHELTHRQCQPAEKADRAIVDIEAWHEGRANVPPTFFADFGTITMAKPWGGKVEVSDDGLPFIHPIANTLDEALAIEPGENEDVANAVSIYRQVCERLGRDDICFKTPDFQGVLNTAGLILKQEELFMDMHGQPDKVHRFLERVCDTNIAMMHSLRQQIGRTDGNIWPYVWLPHDVGVMITEDMMPLLSPDQFKQFGLPYLKRISDEFGGVFIHCCGEWGRHAKNIAESGVNVLGAEFHYPFTKIQEIIEYLPDAVLVPYYADFEKSENCADPDYLKSLLDNYGNNTRLWLAMVDADPWPVEQISKHMQAMGIDFEGFFEL